MPAARRTLLSVGLALAAVGSGAVASAAAADTARPVWCAAGGSVSAASVAGGFSASQCARDDVTVVDGAASVRLPARGESVTASVLTTSGASLLTVARSAAGRVTIRHEAPTTPASPTTTASACSSGDYVTLGYHVSGSYKWAYNPAGAPRSVAKAAASTLKVATTNITAGRDDCGIGSKPRTSNTYLGTTKAAPGLTSTARCGGNDGRSVTGWKSLSAGGVLAVTCTYTRGAVVVASDAAINTRFAWSTSKAFCHNAYDLKGVMTHERGHTFGLGHATGDPALTMYPSVRACDFTKSTLGRGDLLGLLRIYGSA